MTNVDMVNSPSHYRTKAGIEAIDVIENYALSNSFHLGNALKYLLRAGRKGAAREDLAKSLWYVDRWIDRHEAGMEDDPCARREALSWASPEEIADAFDLRGFVRSAVQNILYAASVEDDDCDERGFIVRARDGIQYALDELAGQSEAAQ